MEIVKKTSIKKGSIIECLTPDGWETGKVVSYTNTSVTAFMDYIGQERTFTLDLIR